MDFFVKTVVGSKMYGKAIPYVLYEHDRVCGRVQILTFQLLLPMWGEWFTIIAWKSVCRR